jgi:5-formyltetrahydrofolate cyclo-ligase
MKEKICFSCYDINMEKSRIRESVLSLLKEQNRQVKDRKDRELLGLFVSSAAYKESLVIATYLAFDFEFNTMLLIEQAQKDGKKIVVPKTYPKGKMIFVTYNESDLVKTRFGLLEPLGDQAVEKAKIDLIHVPGLAFNFSGFRVGYGAGYYDRYLTNFRGSTVSTIYDFQREVFQESPHDIAVKEVFIR